MYQFDLDLSLIPQTPNLFLCRPDRTIIANLNPAYNINHKLKLGNVSELNFSLPYEIELNHEFQRNPHIDLIHYRYLIKLKQGNFEEWFIIDKPNDNMEEDSDYKLINCFSLQYELKNKKIRSYSVASYNIQQVINDILTDTLWIIDYITPSILNTYRSFEISSKSVLDFILNDIVSTFNVIPIFNTIDRKISFYKEEEIGIDRGLSFNYGKYLKTLNKEFNIENHCTKLKCFGKDNLSIQEVNPTGQNYLFDYSHFLYPYSEFDLGIAQSGTNTTNITIVNHDLNTGDYIVNKTRNHEVRQIIKIDNNNVTVSTITSQTIGDSIYKILGNSDYMNDSLSSSILSYNSLLQSKDKIEDIAETGTTVTNLKLTDHDLVNNDYILNKTRGNKYSKVTIVDVNNITVNTIEGQQSGDIIYKYKNNTFRKLYFQNKDLQLTLTTKQNELTNLNNQKLIVLDNISIQQENNTITTYNFIYNGITVTKTTNLDNANKYVVMCKVSSTTNLTVKLDTVTKTLSASTWAVLGKIANLTSTSIEFSGTATSVDIKIVVCKISDTEYTTTGNESTLINNYCLDNIQTQIDVKQTEINQTNTDITNKYIEITNLKNQLSLTSNFTIAQLDELKFYNIEDEWSNDNLSDALDLYESGIDEFIKKNIPQTIINIDAVNFLEILTEQKNWDKLNLGDIVRVKYEKLNIDIQAKIIELEFDHETGNINLVIANIQEILNEKDKVLKKLYNSIHTTNNLNVNKDNWNNVATNFDFRNDRISVKPANPVISNDGTAIDHTINIDGSVDMSFEWNFIGTGDSYNIDGFIVYVRSLSINEPYVFGSAIAKEQIYNVNSDKRAFILYGVPANQYYTFGIQSYRSVDEDIDNNGILKSDIVKSIYVGENPYLPSSNVAFSGDVIGTIDGVEANTVVINAEYGSTAYTGTAKYRSSGAPTNIPKIKSISIVQNPNASMNIKLEWATYIQGVNQADFLLLFWKKGAAPLSTPTINDSCVSFNVNTLSDSYYIFEGVSPSDNYTFGLAAARRTESGLEIGQIISPNGTPASFTRNSTAYKQDGSMVADNNPRFEDGVFGQGIMIEEGTTNLYAQSNLSGFHGWPSNVNAVQQANQFWKLSWGTTDTEWLCNSNINISNGSSYTESFYFYCDGTPGTFDITFFTNLGHHEVVATIVPVGYSSVAGQFLYRAYATYTTVIGDNLIRCIDLKNKSGGTWTYIAVGWASLEQKLYATTFHDSIRAAETMTIPTAGIFAKGAWTVEGAFIPQIPTNINNINKSLFYCSIDANNYYKFVIGWGSEWHLNVTSNGVSKIISGGATVMGTPYSWMIAGNGSVIRLCVNGSQMGSDLTYAEPIGTLPANVYIGSDSSGASQANGIIDNLRISNRARTLVEHQADYNTGFLTYDSVTTYLLPFNNSIDCLDWQDITIGTTNYTGYINGVPASTIMDTIAPTIGTINNPITNSNGTITITWSGFIDEQSGIGGYNIWRATSSTGTNKFIIGTVSSANNLIFTDISTIHNITYYYWVTCFDNHGNETNTPISEWKQITALNIDYPSTPVSISVIARLGKIDIAWDKSTSIDVVAYRLEKSINSGTDYSALTITNTNSYIEYNIVETKENIVNWRYRVKAIDIIGLESTTWVVSSNPNTTIYLPADGIAPNTPNTPTGSSSYDGSITIQWTHNSPSVDLIKYKIYRSENNINYYSIAEIDKNTLKYVDTGLKNGQIYYYKISSIDYSGMESSLTSASSGLLATDQVAPSVPNPTATSDLGAIKVIWTEVSEKGVTYEIWRCSGGTWSDASATKIATIAGSTSGQGGQGSYVDYDPPAGTTTTYTYKLKAIDVWGNISGFSTNSSTATSTIDFNGTIDGVEANTVVINAEYGSTAYTGTAKYRSSGAPTNIPKIKSISIVQNPNASMNIKLEWATYIQGVNQADFLLLFWKKGAAPLSTPTINDSCVSFNVNTLSDSYYIFEGVSPSDNYTFGLAAARRTESGLEIGQIISPNGTPASFTRNSTAYKQDGSMVASGIPRYEYIRQSVPVWQDLFDTDQLASKYTKYEEAVGTYTVSGGRLFVTTGAGRSFLIKNDLLLQDCEIEINSDQMQDGGIVARWQDINNHYVLIFNDDSGATPSVNLKLYKRVGGTYTELANVDITWTRGTSKLIKFSLHGSRIDAYFDGVKVIEKIDTAYTGGGIGLRSGANVAAANYYLDLKVYYASPGVMIEEGTTNLLTANQADGVAAVAGNNLCNVTSADTTHSRHGGSALKVAWNGTAGDANVKYNLPSALTVNTNYTFEVWVYAESNVYLLTNGIYIQEAGGSWRSIAAVGSGLTFIPGGVWTRLSGVGTTMSDWYGYSHIILRPAKDASGNLVTTPIWYDTLKVENKAYVTSWIDGGSTRVAETMTIPTSGTFIKSNWAVEMTVSLTNNYQISKYRYLWYIRIDANNFYNLMLDWNGVWWAEIRSGGLARIITGGTATIGGVYNVILSGNGSIMRLFVNSVQIGSDLTYTEPVGILTTNMYIGSKYDGSLQLNGIIDDLMIYNNNITTYSLPFNNSLACIDWQDVTIGTTNYTGYINGNSASDMETTTGSQGKVDNHNDNTSPHNLPSYCTMTSDGIKVFDNFDYLRCHLGQYASGKYGLKVIDGEIYSSSIRTGSETDTTFIALTTAGEIIAKKNGNIILKSESGVGDGNLYFHKEADGVQFGRLLRYTDLYPGFTIESVGNGLSLRSAGNIDTVLGSSSNVFTAHGNFNAIGGSKNCVEETSQGIVALSVRESPDIRYIDENRVTLVNGECKINVDPLFMECTLPDSDDTPWLIHLTPTSPEILYVSEIGDGYFIIKSSEQASNSRCFWKLSSVRKGYAGVRFQKFYEEGDILISNWEDDILKEV